MNNREKVIKGLEICYCPLSKCKDCPYYNLPDEQSCNDVLCLDALALLKEQEPLKPKSKVRHGANGQIQHFCGKCNAILYHHKQKFCIECGQAVKWE